MKEVFDIVIDLVEHLLKRCLIIYLLHGLLAVKQRYIRRERLVEAGFLIITTSYYAAVNYLPVLKKLLYGNEEGIVESRGSIFPMFLSMLVMLAYCLYFYDGKRRRISYLIFTAYTINELTMFTLHTFFTLLFRVTSDLMLRLAMDANEFILKNFMIILYVIQILWNLSFQVVFLLVYYYSVKALKNNLSYVGKKINRVQELFLAVPSAMGLCLCILLRSILYAYHGKQIRFLIDEYPETNVLIPLVSSLSLLLIILSAVILKKLVESSENEVLVEVYQNWLNDMEEHMKDVEHLYDGIRGIRHDMKNHVADLEILLKQNHTSDGEYKIEMQKYLDDMCNTMEELDMSCNTGNPVTDVVISRKIRKAGEEKVPIECNFIYPSALNISAFDLSILLNNGLDNALEASEKEQKPYICLDSYVRERMFFIEIRNAFTGNLPENGEGLHTTKSDAALHGMGMKNMKRCAEKYYGALKWKSSNGEFLLTIMLQGMEEKYAK